MKQGNNQHQSTNKPKVMNQKPNKKHTCQCHKIVQHPGNSQFFSGWVWLGPVGSHVGRGFHPWFFSEASLFLYYWRGGHGHPHLGSKASCVGFEQIFRNFNRYFCPSNVLNLKSTYIYKYIYIYVYYLPNIYKCMFFFKNAIRPMKYSSISLTVLIVQGSR